MGSSGNNPESGADGDVNCGNPGPEFSEVKTVSKWARSHSDDILAKNVAALGPCPKNLLEAKLKRFGLTMLAEGFKTASSLLSCGY